MAFYVNEDRPDGKATVHRDDGPCEVPRDKQERDGRWHGPFDAKHEALRAAHEDTNGLEVRECRLCGP